MNPWGSETSDLDHARETWERWNYASRTAPMLWRGRQIGKMPIDLYLYAEAIQATKCNTIIECGTWEGGSALFFAEMGLDVITIDPTNERDETSSVHYVKGSSLDPNIIAMIAYNVTAPGVRTMVSLDSDHHALHVHAEMCAYGPLVSPGCYMVVEDTIYSPPDFQPDHDLMLDQDNGPAEAVARFLAGNPGWTVDRVKERFGSTSNPGGWLVRDDH